MITQQVAAYLIKKMTAAVKNPSKAAEDPTDELFKFYLSERSRNAPRDIICDGEVASGSVVDAFRWRAADLVRTSDVVICAALIV
jgi:acyl-CoA oxidase